MEGEIRISGSKNACLAIMAGSVLCDKKITLIDVPDIKDIFSMSNLINELGGKISIDGTQFDKYDVNTPIIEIDNSKISNYTADYESVKKMRASIFVLGPLLTRFHKAKVSLPGGCVIGARGIDLHIEVPPVEFKELSSSVKSETSAEIKKRVDHVRRIQNERFKNTGIKCNARITPALLSEMCPMDDNAKSALQKAFDILGLSGRAYDKILKVSRTIADLDNSEIIRQNHIYEAIQYRSLDRKYWNA